MSASSEEAEQKKKSQAIERVIEEDSRRLQKECKILLSGIALDMEVGTAQCRILTLADRVRRERQVHHCETNEDHSSSGLFKR